MCGIFGYVGSNKAAPILINGLKDLEYRGYDSAGIFLSECGPIKAVGPVVNLEAKLSDGMGGGSGIAHTRWATHGVPSEANAHPHHDKDEKVWLVHNGIIENYHEIKSDLQSKGITFYSDTDTEVLAKLIGTLYQGSLQESVVSALKQVRGTYGIAVMYDQDPNQIIVARMGSPIVIGVAEDGNYISSDPSALLAYTKEVIYLEDGEVAVVTGNTCEVATTEGERKEKTTETITWDYTSVQKNGYAHFMLKEIFEAPTVIEDTIRGRVNGDTGQVKLGGLESVLPQLKDLNRLQIVGCGSAFYAGLVGRYMLKEYAHLPTEIELGSEYRYTRLFVEDKTALLVVSQSGETADTLASLRLAKEKNLLTLGVINTVGSTMARETNAGVYNHAGPEIAVASTKAFISQLTVFALLTLLIGRERGLEEKVSQEIAKAITNLPNVLRTMLEDTSKIEEIARRYAKYENMMLIGRKLHAPIAYEGALKIKEVTYIHAEGYAGGELKHGPIALLHDGLPVIALAPQDDVYEKMCSNVEEVKARKAPVLAIVNYGDVRVKALADDVIEIPLVHPIIQPIVTTVALQLLSYHMGVTKGFDVDRPRNLAKSVTVE